tara:strand:- start:214 stop:618 length:405 start_codon:yes stop_codon:yes gene_type:complete
MNVRGPGLIDGVLLASITADLRSLVGDGDVAPVTVTVSTPTADPVIDRAAGTYTRATDDDTVSVLRCEVNLEDIAAAQGGLQVGDIRYHIMAADVSTTPTTESVVIDGSDRLAVIHVSQDPLARLYTLTGRRIP